MQTLTSDEIKVLLNVNSTRTVLAQLAQWKIEPIPGDPADEPAWPANEVREKISTIRRFLPGTPVYWRAADTIHYGKVEEILPARMRRVRAADGTLLRVSASRLIEAV